MKQSKREKPPGQSPAADKVAVTLKESKLKISICAYPNWKERLIHRSGLE
jgi:hypothetical protein